MPETSHANRLHSRCMAFVVAQSENAAKAIPTTRYATATRSTMSRLRLPTEASMYPGLYVYADLDKTDGARPDTKTPEAGQKATYPIIVISAMPGYW